MAPLIVIALVLVGGVVWRARATRRLTIEESVDNYRRTLSAVHEAATRPRSTDGQGGAKAPDVRRDPSPRFAARRFAAPRSRRRLVVATMGAATVVAVVFVLATTTHDHPTKKSSAPTTTTRAPVTRPRASSSSTTAKPAPTTTVPLLTADSTGTQFTIGKPSYTLAVQTVGGACWVDMRNPAGTALFSGTLASGASQSVTATAVTVKLGNPAAARLTVEGTLVAFTVAGGSPVTLHFQGTPGAE